MRRSLNATPHPDINAHQDMPNMFMTKLADSHIPVLKNRKKIKAGTQLLKEAAKRHRAEEQPAEKPAAKRARK